MFQNSFIFNSINRFLSFIQEKNSYLWENSLFLQNIDKLIFASIIGVFVLSTFMSSDVIGYIGLITIFLTLIKLFVKKGEKLEINTFEVLLLAYLMIVIISLFGSSLLYLSLKGFMKTATYLGFYFSAVQYFKNNLNKIPFALFIIAICAGSQGMIGFFQNFTQLGEISTWQDVSNLNPEEVMTRVYGTLLPLNPNLLGGYLVATLPAAFGTALINFIDKKYKMAILAIVIAGITSITLVLTGCRGAYLGLLAIFGLFFLLLAKFIWQNIEQNKELYKKMYLSFVGACISLSTLAVLSISSLRARVFSIFAMRQDSSTSFRLNVYQSAIKMIHDNWLLGIGIGNQNFREIYGLYMKTGFDALSAYSIYLEIAVESGIFALAAFLLFLGIFITKSTKFILKEKDLKLVAITATSLICVAAVMIHGFVDTVFFRPQIQFIFWSMVAFASAVFCNSKEA